MEFESIQEIKKYFEENQYSKEVHNAIDFLMSKVNDVKQGEFEGLILTDYYCNGFFGRRYDLSGSIIVNSGKDYITIRDNDGDVDTAYFEEGWQLQEMRELIEKWTK